MLAVRVNANVLRTFGAKQMHRVREHHSALIEMVLVITVSLTNAVGRRRERRYQIFEIQSPPLNRIRHGI
jgi:hypothetical protein